MSPGKANAHLTFRRATSRAAIPGFSWNRVFEVFRPQPVHCGPLDRLKAAGAPWHIAFCAGVETNGVASDLRVRNSAIARRSPAVRLFAIVIMLPVSIEASTRSAGIALNASRFGARLTPVSWQLAQLRS